VEVLLLVVILFLLSQKSYKHPKRPLTKKVSVASSSFVSYCTLVERNCLLSLCALCCLVVLYLVRMINHTYT